MTSEETEGEVPRVTENIGARLRAGREARGLTLAQVAAETKIPQRHLSAMEESDFAALPARTYAVGFSRTYARLLELNENEVIAQVRAELDAQEPVQTPRAVSFEPGDPARVPSRGLLWLTIGAGVVVLALIFFFMRSLFAPAAELPSLVEQEAVRQAATLAEQQAQAQPETAATPAGPVMFTAQENGVWVKFYDAAGRQLMQKQMALGETYTVPADAQGPQLWTGRPDALSITIGGQEVPALARQQQIMRDVPVDAAALLGREQPAAAQETASPTG